MARKHTFRPPATRDSKGHYVKGTSGNPAGTHGPTNRVWASLLKLQMQKEIELADGTTITGEQLIANLIQQALTTGKVTFPKLKGQTGKPRSFTLSQQAWASMMERTRAHLEPGPKQELDVTTDGKQLPAQENVVFYIPHNPRQDMVVKPDEPENDSNEEPS